MKKVNWKKPEKKRRLDICPYCHGKMEFEFMNVDRYRTFTYSRNIDGCFRCPDCRAQSPIIVVDPSLIDLKKVAERTGDFISDVFEEREEKEEYVDE